MSLRLNKRATRRSGRRLEILSGTLSGVYVLETNGDLDRHETPGWSLGDETLVEGFADESLSVSLGTGPFTANADGEYGVWFPTGVYDLYAPFDASWPLTRWQDAAGVDAARLDSVESTLGAVRTALPVNVKDAPHHAVGDGVTDDTAAIQSAVDTGRNVYVPAGTYLVSSIVYSTSLTITGAGSRKTILKRLPAASGGMLGGVVGGIGALTAVEDLVVSDITFDGDQANTTYGSNAAAMLHVYHCKRVHVSRCRFMNGSGYGIGLQGYPTAAAGKTGPQLDVYLEKCEFLNNGYINNVASSADGLDVKDCERLTMIDCYASGNSDKGFNLRGRYISCFGCRSEANTVGWDLNAHNSVVTKDADSHIMLTACSAASNTGGGFAVTSTEDSATRATLTGCVARANGGAGIGANNSALGSVRVTVVGGHVFEHASHGLSFNGTEQLAITGVAIHSNGGDGVRLTDVAAGATITSCDIRGNTAWGVRSTGTSDLVALAANRFKDNPSGAFTLTGAGNVTTGANVTA